MGIIHHSGLIFNRLNFFLEFQEKRPNWGEKESVEAELCVGGPVSRSLNETKDWIKKEMGRFI